MTPGLLEFDRRRQVLSILVKQYAASHEDADGRSIPKDWADLRLEELGEPWRLMNYTLDVDPRTLMADYET